ncbi:hypothetical protein BsWGS_19218 [Bradybaena similaris]
MAANGVFDQYRDDFTRDDMRQDEDDRYRRAARNGGPSFDRFNTDYLDQNSLSDFRSSEPKFELDHLATFSAGSRNGVIHAEDGLRKLRQMENTTGIWSMRCILIVERNHLVIVDNSTGEELEKFPIQLVQDPTAIFKNDRREIYNNLILFTIIDDPKKRSPQADMHIFQSSRAPAQEIVDEILAAKSGQQRLTHGGEPRILPPAGALAPDPASKAYNFQGMREFIDSRQYQINNTATEMQQFNQAAAYNQHSQFSGPLAQRQSLITRVTPMGERESIEGGSTEVLEKDVQLLNHCFDDIEKFVARLQQAAESYKELEKRKRDRGAKNKKKQSGDGMLNARARPPPDRDFVDIFQKFKLSFNLLAKLKAHIHDPNAPELVHFLFTPLSLIYEASRDPYHGNQNLGDQAMAPVITGDAKQLLLNCLTSKEIELWQALGKHWTTSRDEWQGPIPPYVPEFYDGWQPAAGLDDVPSRPALMTQPNIIAAPLPMIEPARTPSLIDVRERGHVLPQRPIPFPDDDGPVVDIFHRQDDFNRGYRPNAHEFDSRGFEPVNLPSRGFEPPAGRNYESSRFEAQSHERTPPRAGRDSPFSSDFAQPHNMERISRQDVPRNTDRDHVPPGGTSRQEENAAYLDELRRVDDVIIYEAAHDRMGKNAKELTVHRGDILQVVDNSKNWWKLRNFKGEIGFAPYTILKEVKAQGGNNFNQPQQVTGRYQPAAPARGSYLADERGHANRGEFKYF